jgi:hypothetical protein
MFGFGSGVRFANAELETRNREVNMEREHELRTENPEA